MTNTIPINVLFYGTVLVLFDFMLVNSYSEIVAPFVIISDYKCM